jgi:hypothetical protein
MIRGARVTRTRAEVPAVVVVHAKNMKEAWCLATTLSERKATDVVKLYGRRFTIEETFRDQIRGHAGIRARDLAVLVGEQRKRDAVVVREHAGVSRRVHADRQHGHAACAERFVVTGQLAELVLAPRSPVAAIKHERDGPCASSRASDTLRPSCAVSVKGGAIESLVTVAVVVTCNAATQLVEPASTSRAARMPYPTRSRPPNAARNNRISSPRCGGGTARHTRNALSAAVGVDVPRELSVCPQAPASTAYGGRFLRR